MTPNEVHAMDAARTNYVIECMQEAMTMTSMYHI